MKQADDFRAECANLEALLAPLQESDFARATRFKCWSIDDILRHLHLWDRAALWSLQDEAAFRTYVTQAMPAVQASSLPGFERDYLGGLSGRALFDAWHRFTGELADAFAKVDPSKRVPWAGPSMSARSSITARLMETWAHAQAIYDELSVVRTSTDAIQNIVILGFNTYGWAFTNRGLPVPEPRPHLSLRAPSGALWEYGEPSDAERIEGEAEAFCQVVAQTRNIADTRLRVTGPNAAAWMTIAQCFAGPPNDPPQPGERRMRI